MSAVRLPILLACLLGPSALAGSMDPFFAKQWALKNDGTQTVTIDWDDSRSTTQKGLPGIDIGWMPELPIAPGSTLAPVTVAVVDYGVDLKHPDLQGRVLSDGWDFLSRLPVMIDDQGHGTHVSGIIAATAQNSLGIAGAAPSSVKILPLRILSRNFINFAYNGKFVSDYAAEAIRYAVSHGASVINFSLGWPKLVNTDNVKNAVREAVQKGVLIVAAAGNDRKDQPTYPCAFEGVLCVGAITNTGALTWYSNSGGSVDLVAPGDGILSLYPTNIESRALRIRGYELLSGTSQAAPYVSAIAATLKSVFPTITPQEIKARLLVSGLATVSGSSTLYGSAHLKRAIEARPQPVFLPDFKTIDEIIVDERTLRLQGALSVQNLWTQATGVRATLLINGEPAGEAQAATLESGARLTIPCSYGFKSLDEASDLRFSLKVEADSQPAKTFELHVSAARFMQAIANTQVIAIPSNIKPRDWIGSNNGHLFSLLKQVVSLPAETGLPRYYQQRGSQLQIFSPPQLFDLPIPTIKTVTQVIRFKDGRWVVIGTGADSTRPYLEFDFFELRDDKFKPASNAPVLRFALDTTWALNKVLRNYTSAGNWLKKGNLLLPAFMDDDLAPTQDDFDELDQRHAKVARHLYYLEPRSPKSTQLVARVLNDAAFKNAHPGMLVHNLIPGDEPGHIRLLMAQGKDLAAKMFIWNLRDVSDQRKETALRLALDWSWLASAGQPLSAVSSDPGAAPVFLTFFDSTRGSLNWTTAEGSYLGRSKINYSSPHNPITGLIGAFSSSQSGRVWFLESAFELVAFHDKQQAALPLERDSTFPGQMFSEMLSPVLVRQGGATSPGIYIDSTLVRGNRVSVAVWNTSQAKLTKPLRYSLQVPPGCVQMSPVIIDPMRDPFVLPVLCARESQLNLFLVRP